MRKKVQGPAKAKHACQNKAVLPLAAKNVERGGAYIAKKKPRDRYNMKCEEKLHSFDIAASFKNM